MTSRPTVRTLLAAAALGLAPLAAPHALAAQQVVMPSHRKTLDPARVLVRRDVLALSDSLLTVQAMIARFEHDPASPSDGVQLSRARALAGACRNAQRQVEPTRATVRDTKFDAGQTKGSVGRPHAALLQGFGPLMSTLVACDSTFRQMATGPKAAAVVRDWGLYRAHKVRDQLNAFQQLANTYLASLGIRPTPPGYRGTLDD
jgi:hypothetical protein